MRANKFCRVDKETDLTAIQMYKQGKSLTQISKELGLDRPSLSKRLQKQGLKLRDNRIYSVDLQYFAEIDDEHKAYWLGFILADGTVQDKYKRHVFEITLKEEDSYMLEILKSDIQSNAPICDKIVTLNGYQYPASRFTVSSKEFVANLVKCGCVPNKTKVVRVLDGIVSDDLMNHFVRGYFDGNGCIGITSTRKPSDVTVSIGSGSVQMMEDLWNIIANQTGLCFRDVSKSSTYYEMRLFSIDDKLEFLKYIYNNATVYLERKHKKYMQFAAMRRRPSKFS